MKKLFGILIVLMIIGSCVPYRYLAQHHAELCNQCIDEYAAKVDTTKKVIIKHDTIYRDVSENLHDTTKVYLGCDSLGNVVLLGVQKIGDLKRIVTSYVLKNNVLIAVNTQLNSKVMVLQDSITILKDRIRILDKPAITIYKTPIWVYWVGAVVFLFLIALIVLIIKK